MSQYFFVGMAGTGMSSLAHFLRAQGHKVMGSDRSFDQKKSESLQEQFKNSGIVVVPQDGAHLPSDLTAVIYSSAVESDNPDFVHAQKQKFTRVTRAEMLAQIFNQKEGIAVSGTSGKTTVTGMMAHILKAAGWDFSFLCGGQVKNFPEEGKSSNWHFGKGPWLLAEADESDGSLVHYRPKISVITNISKDHKDLKELHDLFQHLVLHTGKAIVINSDCPETKNLSLPKEKSFYFGKSKADHIRLLKEGSRFEVDEAPYHLKIPGVHNIMNALASIATAQIIGIPIHHIQRGLENFQGVERRLELIGKTNNIRVYDDFAHNPAKIEATLNALQDKSDRVIAVYQPHGFGPLKHQWQELIEILSKMIRPQDQLYLLPIYDAGGTADRSISSESFVEVLKKKKIPTFFCQDRETLLQILRKKAKKGDNIVVMGARDHTLTELAHQIVRKIQKCR
ncbi:MAG: hypothetical protein HYS08_09800 [Chlamydiae bacterium]|nr:hypothetical protein [Chlamydiota bacterium]MBI3267354.1 hypothetical protein [Chlamydiota bacterium]